MYFKNAQIYRLSTEWPITLEALHAQLGKRPPQALPTHIASHWIDRGHLIATHTNQQALEAA